MTAHAPEGVRIRRAEPGDYAGFADVLGSPSVYGATLQLPYPSQEIWRERLSKVDPEGCILVAEARPAASSDDGFEIIGHLGLMANGSASPRRRHAVALGISIADAWQGRGVGTALLTTALDRADNWMNVLRIELTVFTDNAAAIALYRRHGFEIEGTHRAYALRGGVYADAYTMARLHPAPPRLPHVPSGKTYP